MKRYISSLVIASFFVAASPAFAQLGAVKEGAKTVGQATVETTKDAAHATKKGTEKVAGKTKSATETTYKCSDGTTDRVTLKANACKDHGGVKPAARKH